LDEDYNKVVNILIGIIKVNFKERLLADSCLERGYYNGLFKKTCNNYIVDINNIKVNTLKDAIAQAEEANNRAKTLTLRLL